MLFRSPPIDPWCVVSGQSDYMAWTVEEIFQKIDLTDCFCRSVSEQFTKKNFIQIHESFARKFCEAHSIFMPQTVVRVKNCQVVWVNDKPKYEEILEQAQIMGVRNKPGDLKPSITKDNRKTCMIFPEHGFKPLNCEGKEIKNNKSINAILRTSRENKKGTHLKDNSNIKLIWERPIDNFNDVAESGVFFEIPRFEKEFNKSPKSNSGILSKFSKFPSSKNLIKYRGVYKIKNNGDSPKLTKPLWILQDVTRKKLFTSDPCLNDEKSNKTESTGVNSHMKRDNSPPSCLPTNNKNNSLFQHWLNSIEATFYLIILIFLKIWKILLLIRIK